MRRWLPPLRELAIAAAFGAVAYPLIDMVGNVLWLPR